MLEALENGIERKVLQPRDVGIDGLKGFLGEFGRRLYGEPALKWYSEDKYYSWVGNIDVGLKF